MVISTFLKGPQDPIFRYLGFGIVYFRLRIRLLCYGSVYDCSVLGPLGFRLRISKI